MPLGHTTQQNRADGIYNEANKISCVWDNKTVSCLCKNKNEESIRNVVAFLDTVSCRRNVILKQRPDDDRSASASVLALCNANYNDSDVVATELPDCLVDELVAGSLAP